MMNEEIRRVARAEAIALLCQALQKATSRAEEEEGK